MIIYRIVRRIFSLWEMPCSIKVLVSMKMQIPYQIIPLPLLLLYFIAHNCTVHLLIWASFSLLSTLSSFAFWGLRPSCKAFYKNLYCKVKGLTSLPGLKTFWKPPIPDSQNTPIPEPPNPPIPEPPNLPISPENLLLKESLYKPISCTFPCCFSAEAATPLCLSQ